MATPSSPLVRRSAVTASSTATPASLTVLPPPQLARAPSSAASASSTVQQLRDRFVVVAKPNQQASMPVQPATPSASKPQDQAPVQDQDQGLVSMEDEVKGSVPAKRKLLGKVDDWPSMKDMERYRKHFPNDFTPKHQTYFEAVKDAYNRNKVNDEFNDHHRHEGVNTSERYHRESHQRYDGVSLSTIGALGHGQPDLRFGHMVHKADMLNASMVRTFLSNTIVLAEQDFVVNTGWLGQCFNMRYDSAHGAQIFKGSLSAAFASGVTSNPLTAPATPLATQNPGWYDLFKANSFYDAVFRYLHVEGIEMEYRWVPTPPMVNTPTVMANPEDNHGHFNVMPYYGEPGMWNPLTGGLTDMKWMDRNYMTDLKPLHRRMLKARSNNAPHPWTPLGFIPTTLTLGAEGDIEYQELAPVDTVTWIAGTSNQNCNLGCYWWDRVGMCSPGDTNLNSCVQIRFAIKVRWWELIPPQLYSLSTPQVDPVVMRKWANDVLAADAAAAADEALLVSQSTALALGAVPPSSPVSDQDSDPVIMDDGQATQAL